MPVLEQQNAIIQIGSEGERIDFAGYRMIFKSPLPGSKEGEVVIDYTIPAQQPGAPLHYHKELTESFYVISGALWIRVGDREFNAGPGSYFLVPPGTWHSFANRSDMPTRILATASNAKHKDFLTELFEIARAEDTWPPRDRRKLAELGDRYDSFYAQG